MCVTGKFMVLLSVYLECKGQTRAIQEDLGKGQGCRRLASEGIDLQT